MLLRVGAAVCVCIALHAETTWTRFRGPNGTGVVESTALPVEFNKQQNMLWRTALQPGFSSPVIGAKCIFVTTYEWPKLFTACLRPNDGTLVWQQQTGEAPGKKPPVNTPVSSTPVTDGHNVYVFMEHAGLVSYDESGKERWRTDLGKFNNPYGMANSPVLVGSTLVLQADQDTGAYLLAVNAENGKTLWKVERPDAQHGYSTPVVYQPKRGAPQIILSGSFQVTGYSLKNGEKLWWVDGMAWQAKSTPILAGDMLFVHSWMAQMNELVKLPDVPWDRFLADHDKDQDGAITKEEMDDPEIGKLWFLFDLDRSGKVERRDFEVVRARNTAKSGLFAIQLGGSGDLTATAVKWKVEKALPNIPSPVLYQGVLYILREGGILTVYDPKSGEILKQGRIEGAVDPYFASPVAADGKLFAASAKGKIAVLKAATQWEVLKVNDLDEEIWATPAIDDGKLYVRTQNAMYCFGLKEK